MSSLRPLMSLWAFSLVKGARCSIQHPTVCIYFKGSRGTSLDSERHVWCSNSTAMTCVYPCAACVRKWVGVRTLGAQTPWHVMRNEHAHTFFTSAGIRWAVSQAGATVTHVRPEEAVPHELAWKADITNTVYNLSHSYGSAALGPAISQIILSPILSLICPLQQCEGCSPVLCSVVNDSLSKNSSV